jgi:hypothetical protein
MEQLLRSSPQVVVEANTDINAMHMPYVATIMHMPYVATIMHMPYVATIMHMPYVATILSKTARQRSLLLRWHLVTALAS